eukprot:7209913-Prymnesium_polylepis.1
MSLRSAALKSRDFPKQSHTLGSAPAVTSIFSTSRLPYFTQKESAEHPLCGQRRSASAPPSRRARTTSSPKRLAPGNICACASLH